uniref:Uncharacterized protein n=1 Tax=Chromera velia CCMP2878 TaxID=1169474 RepID=A0A0G4I035_9ALVE|eukprot:Cvel_9851.t1-p1 / transcript=Cvel_9851.t1 / gene=Cvel_9851 / organism=Chromera_velia_CCMP2878 / gene_product=hypothetical protein / transcript_product=hypothetical protein / location=Cvel_scaffold580:13071-20503(-) / protein_length=1260 / sequence_SO=supercontig / SO=protein_coding / is_pseudo=false
MASRAGSCVYSGRQISCSRQDAQLCNDVEQLVYDRCVSRPFVVFHLVNRRTGKYLRKSERTRVPIFDVVGRELAPKGDGGETSRRKRRRKLYFSEDSSAFPSSPSVRVRNNSTKSMGKKGRGVRGLGRTDGNEEGDWGVKLFVAPHAHRVGTSEASRKGVTGSLEGRDFDSVPPFAVLSADLRGHIPLLPLRAHFHQEFLLNERLDILTDPDTLLLIEVLEELPTAENTQEMTSLPTAARRYLKEKATTDSILLYRVAWGYFSPARLLSRFFLGYTLLRRAAEAEGGASRGAASGGNRAGGEGAGGEGNEGGASAPAKLPAAFASIFKSNFVKGKSTALLGGVDSEGGVKDGGEGGGDGNGNESDEGEREEGAPWTQRSWEDRDTAVDVSTVKESVRVQLYEYKQTLPDMPSPPYAPLSMLHKEFLHQATDTPAVFKEFTWTHRQRYPSCALLSFQVVRPEESVEFLVSRSDAAAAVAMAGEQRKQMDRDEAQKHLTMRGSRLDPRAVALLRREPAVDVLESCEKKRLEVSRVPRVLTHELSGGERGCSRLAISPDGMLLAAAVARRNRVELRVYDLRDGAWIASLRGHHALVYELQWISMTSSGVGSHTARSQPGGWKGSKTAGKTSRTDGTAKGGAPPSSLGGSLLISASSDGAVNTFHFPSGSLDLTSISLLRDEHDRPLPGHPAAALPLAASDVLFHSSFVYSADAICHPLHSADEEGRLQPRVTEAFASVVTGGMDFGVAVWRLFVTETGSGLQYKAEMLATLDVSDDRERERDSHRKDRSFGAGLGSRSRDMFGSHAQDSFVGRSHGGLGMSTGLKDGSGGAAALFNGSRQAAVLSVRLHSYAYTTEAVSRGGSTNTYVSLLAGLSNGTVLVYGCDLDPALTFKAFLLRRCTSFELAGTPIHCITPVSRMSTRMRPGSPVRRKVPFAGEDSVVLLGTLDSTCRLATLQRTSAHVQQTFSGLKASNFPVRCTMSPDGSFVLSGSESGRLCLWEAGSGRPADGKLPSLQLGAPVIDAVWSPTHHLIACCAYGPGAEDSAIFVFTSSEGGAEGGDLQATTDTGFGATQKGGGGGVTTGNQTWGGATGGGGSGGGTRGAPGGVGGLNATTASESLQEWASRWVENTAPSGVMHRADKQSLKHSIVEGLLRTRLARADASAGLGDAGGVTGHSRGGAAGFSFLRDRGPLGEDENDDDGDLDRPDRVFLSSQARQRQKQRLQEEGEPTSQGDVTLSPFSRVSAAARRRAAQFLGDAGDDD